MKKNLPLAFAVVAMLSMLGGCGYIRSKFETKNDAYKNSAQNRPLEIPPDLDAPNRSGTLVIPEPGTPDSAAATDSRVPAPSMPPAAAPPMSATTLAGGEGLTVADTLANTWRRIGLALERSGAATIQARDEAGRSYEIQTTGQATRSPGWFKRAITLGMARDKKVSTPVSLRVRVSGSEGASLVTVEGAATESDSTAARQVLDTLRQRMN